MFNNVWSGFRSQHGKRVFKQIKVTVKPSHGKDIGPILIPLHMRAAFDTHNIQYRDKDI